MFKKNIPLFFWLLLFTLGSIVIRGYEFGGGNQVHYFNYAFHSYYPGIYESDYLFRIHSISFTVFVGFLTMLLRIFGENQPAFFAVYVLFQFGIYATIYKIAQKIYTNKRISFFILLLFIYPISIGGTTIYHIERSLTPRLIAELFLLVSMYLLLVKKELPASVFAAVGFYVHPITMLPYVPIVLLTKFIQFRSVKTALLPVAVFLLMSAPMLYLFLFQPSHAGMFIDSNWREVISERLPYIFIWRWSPVNFLLLAVIWFVSYRYRNMPVIKKFPIIQGIAIVAAVFFSTAVVSALLNFRLGMQLQLARNLYLLVIFILIVGGGEILKKLSARRMNKSGIALVVLVILLSLPGRKKLGFLWMSPTTDYQKAAVWANQHTPTDSVFAVPLSEEAFRFWSKRAVLVEKKDGGDGLYDRNLALTWDEREDLIEHEKFSGDVVSKLKNEYHVNFLVTKQQLPYAVVYRNGTWTIYQI